MHFEDDSIRDIFIATEDRLENYEIENIEKINENLYSVTLLTRMKINHIPGQEGLSTSYNFVVRIGNQWFYLNGINHIPENLRENLNPDNYRYDDQFIDADVVL